MMPANFDFDLTAIVNDFALSGGISHRHERWGAVLSGGRFCLCGVEGNSACVYGDVWQWLKKICVICNKGFRVRVISLSSLSKNNPTV